MCSYFRIFGPAFASGFLMLRLRAGDRMYSCVHILEAHIGRPMSGMYISLYCKSHWLYNERSPPRIGCAVFSYSLYLSTWYQEKATIGLPLPLPPALGFPPCAPPLCPRAPPPGAASLPSLRPTLGRSPPLPARPTLGRRSFPRAAIPSRRAHQQAAAPGSI